LQAKDVMTRDVVTATPDTPLREVARLLVDRRISGMPVVREGRIVGLISEADLLKTFRDLKLPVFIDILGGVFPIPPAEPVRRQLDEMSAWKTEQVMSQEVITIGPETPVEEMARLLRRRNINRLPVVDDKGRLVGIVTRNDIIRGMAGEEEV